MNARELQSTTSASRRCVSPSALKRDNRRIWSYHVEAHHPREGHYILHIATQSLATTFDIRTFNETLYCLECGSVFQSAVPESAFQPCEYEYEALDHSKDQIRFIVLDAGEEADPISCRIYTRQLRHKYEKRTVWVGAICIDQTSAHERNHQVSMMDRIYKGAFIVEICIHDPGQCYEGAMMFFASAGPERGHLTDLDNLAFHTGHKRGHLADLDGRAFQQHPHVAQLKALLRRRYFTRVWIIQEVLLAKVAMLHVNNDIVQFAQHTLEVVQETCRANYVHIDSLEKWASILKRDRGIMSCLRLAMACSASDPKDKVFAITSLLRPEIRFLIPINYTSSLGEVLRNAVTACIAECGDLSILSYASLPSNGKHSLGMDPTFTATHFKEFLANEDYEDEPVVFFERPVECSPITWSIANGTCSCFYRRATWARAISVPSTQRGPHRRL
ncbi:hypothetical protein CC86DRAFT_451526 [Ophiobolus disseminans]|uniref:Heterokaryon incompatibility domain-containing protein n=1 Tax=Ophiobolus disseminans TaxID=1469910 RepID=A0A6A7AL63_9PLEO|nr:hypothetical protein CC86DRAFT_451526 [Ophiobolus disseminans]